MNRDKTIADMLKLANRLNEIIVEMKIRKEAMLREALMRRVAANDE